MNCAIPKDLQICWDCWAKDLFKAKFCFWIRNNLLLVARSYKLNTIELYWTLTPQQQLHQGVPTATCACQRPKRSWSVLARPFKSVGKSCNFGSAVRYFLHFLPGCGLSLWRSCETTGVSEKSSGWSSFSIFPWGAPFPFSGTPKIILVGDKMWQIYHGTLMIFPWYFHYIPIYWYSILFYPIRTVSHSISIRLYIYILIYHHEIIPEYHIKYHV